MLTTKWDTAKQEKDATKPKYQGKIAIVNPKYVWSTYLSYINSAFGSEILNLIKLPHLRTCSKSSTFEYGVQSCL